MNNKTNWKIIAGIIMVLMSIAFYILHYLIFHDAHHIFLYLIGDIAFVFIEVLMVTLIIHHLLNEWEKRSHLSKLNMVIEVFFSEFGKHLLVYLSNYDKNIHAIKKTITDQNDRCDLDFKTAFKALKSYRADIDVHKLDLSKLSLFLKQKRSFLLNLLQNPNLLEHEAFTDTLMSIFHIAEELSARDITNMSQKDKLHTKVDIERAYNSLIHQWLSYMQHTQAHFPYFFEFAMQTNPFDEKASWLDRWDESVPA